MTPSMTGTSSKFESSNSSNTMRLRKKRARANISEDDPVHITRHVQKGFDLAYPEDAYTGPDTTENLRSADISSEERRAWKVPKNPHNEKLQLVGSYPLLPDWDATPDTGAYMLYKFTAAPIKDPVDNSYDPRLDVALLRPAGETQQDHDNFIMETEAWKADPTLPQPIPRNHLEFFLPPDRSKIAGIKRAFTTNDPLGSDVVYDEEGEDEEGNPRKYFKFENIRTYETQQLVPVQDTVYGDVVAIALHDPEHHEEERLRDTKLLRAAYFYPVQNKTYIRPKRPGRIEMYGEEQPKVHIIEAAGKTPDVEAEARDAINRRYDPLDV